MTLHRLYDETCLERWMRRKREEALVQTFREEARVHVRYEGLANPAMDTAHPRPGWRDRDRVTPLRPADDHRRRSSDSDATPAPFPSFPSFDPPAASVAPPTALPEPPSTIDPGGGSSGGAGASGDW